MAGLLGHASLAGVVLGSAPSTARIGTMGSAHALMAIGFLESSSLVLLSQSSFSGLLPMCEVVEDVREGLTSKWALTGELSKTLTSCHIDRARWGLLGHDVLIMGSLSQITILS